jgi:hypothetical protein
MSDDPEVTPVVLVGFPRPVPGGVVRKCGACGVKVYLQPQNAAMGDRLGSGMLYLCLTCMMNASITDKEFELGGVMEQGEFFRLDSPEDKTSLLKKMRERKVPR